MCMHNFIRTTPAAVVLQQERKGTTATPFPGAAGITGENLRVPAAGRDPAIIYAEYSTRDQHQNASPAASQKPAWCIITSEEIGIIYRYLSEIEQAAPEHDKECALEISCMLETVERRLA